MCIQEITFIGRFCETHHSIELIFCSLVWCSASNTNRYQSVATERAIADGKLQWSSVLINVGRCAVAASTLANTSGSVISV